MSVSMEEILTFSWMGKYRAACKYDLAKNELEEQDFTDIGVETSFSEYRRESDPDAYFRETVADIYGLESKNVIPTVGGTEGIFLAGAYLSTLSSSLLVPTPEYEPIFVAPRALGSKVRLVPESEAVQSVGSDESFLMTSPGNPTGKVRHEMFRGMLESTGPNGRGYVDETFSEFLFNKRPLTLMRENDRTVCSTTMTKFFGLTKIRTGWIMSSGEDTDGIMKFKNLTSASNPKYPLWLAANALERRQAYAAKVKDRLERNLPVADRFVNEFDFLEWTKPDSAPFGFVRFDLSVDSEKLCTDVYEKTGILLVPGKFFGTEGGFRLCFFLPPERNREAFGILADYFRDCPFT